MESKRVLILGGAGFLGANLTRYCLDRGAIVTVLDSLDPVFKSTHESLAKVADRIIFAKGDIRDENLLAKAIPDQDIIFNCAAQTSHPISLQDCVLDTDINCIGNLRVLTAIKDYNPNAVVVYTSSSTVTGKGSGVIDENHSEKPLDIYSANKGVAEKYYRIFHNIHGLKTITLRFANLYGPLGKNYPEFGFVNYFINQAKLGNAIKIYGDGNQTRNLMFVDDACEIMWESAHRLKLVGETYFAAHYDHYSVKDIAETVVRIFGSGSVEFIPWPPMRKKIEVDNVIISSARLYGLTGWRPTYNLIDGLRLTQKRMNENY